MSFTRTVATIFSLDRMQQALTNRKLRRRQKQQKKKELPSEISDIFIDLGTATATINSGGEYGKFTYENYRNGVTIQRESKHVRTIVAWKNSRTRAAIMLIGPWQKWKQSRADYKALKEKTVKENKAAKAQSFDVSDTKESGVEAIGQSAFERWDRDPNLRFERAVRRGNVGCVKSYRCLLRYMIRMRFKWFEWSFEELRVRPTIYIGVPETADDHHISSIKWIIEKDLHANAVFVREQIADLIGGRRSSDQQPIPFRGSKSVAIANLGGGTNDIAVACNGKVIHIKSFETAGDAMDEDIVKLLRNKKLQIGNPTAIEIKETIGSALAIDGVADDEVFEVYGTSTETNRPGSVKITRAEIRECLLPVCNRIVEDFNSFLEKLEDNPEIHADIKNGVIYLSGGASQLPGLAKYISKKTKLEIELVANPFTSVIEGLIAIKENEDLLGLGVIKMAA
jgi:rod shape-determining protein MreB